jgi:hypothetical protein
MPMRMRAIQMMVAMGRPIIRRERKQDIIELQCVHLPQDSLFFMVAVMGRSGKK